MPSPAGLLAPAKDNSHLELLDLAGRTGAASDNLNSDKIDMARHESYA